MASSFRLCDSLVRAWRMCVCVCARAICDSVCSICCNNGSLKMASLVLATTNSAVPILNKLQLPSKSFQHSLWPLALSITSWFKWCGKGRLYRAWSTPYTHKNQINAKQGLEERQQKMTTTLSQVIAAVAHHFWHLSRGSPGGKNRNAKNSVRRK